MRLAAQIDGWTRDLSMRGLEEAVRRIVDDGFMAAAFMYDGENLAALTSLGDDDLARLRALGDSLGVAYVVHGPYQHTNIGSLDERARRASVALIDQALAFAAALCAATVTIHPARLAPGAGGDPQALWPRVQDLEGRSLAKLARRARELGTVLCYENMPTGDHTPGSAVPFHPSGVEPDRLIAHLASLLGPHFGVTYDPAHANVAHQDPLAAVHTLGGAVRHVHLCDNDGSADQHLPLGQGSIDFAPILAALAAIGYDGLLELELGPRHEFIASRLYLQGLARDTLAKA